MDTHATLCHRLTILYFWLSIASTAPEFLLLTIHRGEPDHDCKCRIFITIAFKRV